MNPLLRLIDHGQSYWLDNLTRRSINNGNLRQRVEQEGLRGVTSNPEIFYRAMGHGDEYDGRIAALNSIGALGTEGVAIRTYEALVTADIRDACNILRPVYDRSGGVDGFVSLEVSPHLAHDGAASILEARRLAACVDRPNLFIKIPGTVAGVTAIEELLYEGINVNITLLFSVARYEAVAEAWLRALERRAQAGRSIDTIASVASFFLSRVDVLVDQLLRQRMHADEVRPARLLGRAALANAKLAYQSFRRMLASERWQALERQGARPQRLLWASTSTKDKRYSDVMYVEPLIGPHTVNTMPENTIAAFADHGRVANTLERGVEEAHQVMNEFGQLGIDFAQAATQLENEGIQKFIDPFDALMASLVAKRAQLSR
jgi:transaldolase